MRAEERISPTLYAPPWRERTPDGKLGAEYGPSTAATFARQVARHLDWSYRAQAKARRGNEALRVYMRLDDGTLRLDVPESEVRVYRLIVEQGHSIRWTAKHLGVHRESVRSYMRRLKTRAAR